MTAIMVPARDLASGNRGTWRRGYARNLAVTDTVVLTTATVGADLLWTPMGSTVVLTGGMPTPVPYWLVSLALIGVWAVALGLFASRDQRVVGSGTIEYRRLGEATVFVFGAIAIGSYVGAVELGRAYLLTAFAIGLSGLVLTRWGWRQWLRREQSAGRCLAPVIVVGDRTSGDAIGAISALPGSGYQVIGVVSDEQLVDPAGALHLGGLAHLETRIAELQPHAIIVTSVGVLGQDRMQQLGRTLAQRGAELIVTPGLVGVGGPRIHARPLADLPLLQLDYPELVGAKAVMKRLVDILGALALILLALPVMLAAAVAVATTSPGGFLYRQERVGRGGRPFFMLKFRSMRVDADAELAALLAAQGTDGHPLFKVQSDPRVTKVGRFIRRYSIDELPQFFNVLMGDMSLVGPRPQRPAEVALYDEFASRRHIVKPGVSGLWQVSGRSTLAWEDAIRLDLSYIDNWSLAGDIVILWRTVRAVMRPGAEAY
ncbi:sugar transferase [Planococcus sp. APC 4015]|nr:sugar transferase [Planococcus sp. APC 4015]